MRVAICDDDKTYVDLISKTLSVYFENRQIYFECYTFNSAEALLAKPDTFDMVFLDIKMDKINGIQAAQSIMDKNHNTIIFIITAYHQYLDEAMNLNLFRYIDKPFDSARLYQSLDRAIEIIDNLYLQFLDINNNLVKILMKNVVYVEVSMRNTYIYTPEVIYCSKESIRYFKEKLTASYFVVPHNSYIVNLNFVENFSRADFRLSGGYVIPISQRRQHETRTKFFKYVEEGAYD